MLSECVGSFGTNEPVVVLVPGRNESGERLLEMCAEQGFVVGNSWFKKNDV